MAAKICIQDYEDEAYSMLSGQAWGYYRSGADDETTLYDNVDGFKRYRILPRFMKDVSNVDTEVTDIFGCDISMPIGASPTAMHKLAHRDGELATAKGISLNNSIMILSTLSTVCIEDVASSQPNLIKWFQLYLFKDRQKSLELIKRAELAGFKALVLTVDAPVFGYSQEGDQDITKLDYIDASLQWSDLKWLTEQTSLPILAKGILTPEDAELALEHGASGIIVSNHGGRQLDSAPATIDVLPLIRRRVGNEAKIFIDGGIRTGGDVFKCLALGADFVFVGRPILWGLACDGAEGVDNILKILHRELVTTMKLSGARSLEEIREIKVLPLTMLCEMAAEAIRKGEDLIV